MVLQAGSHSLRYDATARSGNSDERNAPLRRMLLVGSPTASFALRGIHRSWAPSRKYLSPEIVAHRERLGSTVPFLYSKKLANLEALA